MNWRRCKHPSPVAYAVIYKLWPIMPKMMYRVLAKPHETRQSTYTIGLADISVFGSLIILVKAENVSRL